MLIAVVAFDMKDLAKRAVIDRALEFPHAWKATFVVAKCKRYTGLGAGRDSSLGFDACKRQRLLAPDRLADFGHGANLPKVKGMRCSQKDRLHTGIGHNLFEFSGQFKALSGRKIAHQLGLLADSADEAQAIAFALNSLDDIFSPSAEADHSSVYHG